MLDSQTIAAEFGLSGSEQNADLTGKDLRLLAGSGPARSDSLRCGPSSSAGSTSSPAARWPSWPPQMNQLAGEHLVEADALERTIRARDLQVRTGLGKDPQVVATLAAARSFSAIG